MPARSAASLLGPGDQRVKRPVVVPQLSLLRSREFADAARHKPILDPIYLLQVPDPLRKARRKDERRLQGC